jgi:preprotein translocase subunit YajC
MGKFTELKKGDKISVLTFTGMVVLRGATITRATKTKVEVTKQNGDILEFSKSTGKQTNANNAKYANKLCLVEETPKQKQSTPAAKKKTAPKKKAPAKKKVEVEEIEDEEDEEEEEEKPAPKKKPAPAKKKPAPKKKPVVEDEDDEEEEWDDDEDEEI